jgi:hypothetical protein
VLVPEDTWQRIVDELPASARSRATAWPTI